MVIRIIIPGVYIYLCYTLLGTTVSECNETVYVLLSNDGSRTPKIIDDDLNVLAVNKEAGMQTSRGIRYSKFLPN